MIKVFDITRTYPNGESLNVFTSIKTDADKFVFDSMFMKEVEFNYKKIDMDEKEFETELSKRNKAFEKEVLNSTKCL